MWFHAAIYRHDAPRHVKFVDSISAANGAVGVDDAGERNAS